MHSLCPGRRYTNRRFGAHSSSGLGHRPLTAAARVRIPYAPFHSSSRSTNVTEGRQVPRGPVRLAAPDTRPGEITLVEPCRAAAVPAEGVRLGLCDQLCTAARPQALAP